MKKIFYLMILLISFGCDNRDFKEGIGVNSGFPFEFFVEPTNNYYLESIGDIFLTITNSKEIKNQDYTISYEIVGGKGEVYFEEAVVDSLSMKKGKLNVGFKGLNTGEYKLKFKASNGNPKYDNEAEIIIVVGLRPFEIELQGIEEVYITETIPLKWEVKVENPEFRTYKWAWNSMLENVIFKDEVIYAKDTEYPINHNTHFETIFNPKEIRGKHTLLFTFSDSQIQKFTIDKEINVKDIDFSDSLKVIDKEVYFGEKARLNFDFKPDFRSKINPNEYTLKYTLENAEGKIRIDSTELLQGDEMKFSDEPFIDKEVIFTPTSFTNSDAKITFIVTDKYGYSKSTQALLKIKGIDFTGELIPIDKEVYFGEKARLDFKFKPEFESTTNPNQYTLKYTLENAEGTITINNQTINSGQTINLGSNGFDRKEVIFTPTSFINTDAKITFTITDKYGYSQLVSTTVMIKHINFETLLNAIDQEVFFEERARLNLMLKPEFESTDNPNQYTLKYTLENAEGAIMINNQTVNNGQTINLGSNGFDSKEILFTPTSFTNSDAKITFTITDKYGYSKIVSANIKVKGIDFRASLTPLNRDVYFGDQADVILAFIPEFVSFTNPNVYTMNYSVESSEGILTIDGRALKRGESIVLTGYPYDNKTIHFEPTNALDRNANLILTITDKYGYSKTVSTNLNVNLRSYELFTTNNSSIEYLFLNNVLGGAFNIELRTLSNIEKLQNSVRIISTSNDQNNGYFQMNGIRYEYNQDIPLTGQFNNLVYYPTAYGSGKHTLSFQGTNIANQSPSNQVPNVSFEIYKNLEIKKLVARYTIKQVRNGTVFRPSRHEINSYLDFQLNGTSKITNIEIIGTEFERPFNDIVPQSQINQISNNALNGLPIRTGQHNYNTTPLHKVNDKIRVRFTDEKGYITEFDAYFIEEKI